MALCASVWLTQMSTHTGVTAGRVAETLSRCVLPHTRPDLKACTCVTLALVMETLPVEKIKTIGDAYMAVSGLPERREDHAEAMAEFALDLIDVVQHHNARTEAAGGSAGCASRPEPIQVGVSLCSVGCPTGWVLGDACASIPQVRVGIHTGPVIAGIVGDLKFCYDVWGEGVDGAVAMEQGGRANQIHVSQATYERLVSSARIAPCGLVVLVGSRPFPMADDARRCARSPPAPSAVAGGALQNAPVRQLRARGDKRGGGARPGEGAGARGVWPVGRAGSTRQQGWEFTAPTLPPPRLRAVGEVSPRSSLA
jgi:class 3 adenylate cyclase